MSRIKYRLHPSKLSFPFAARVLLRRPPALSTNIILFLCEAFDSEVLISIGIWVNTGLDELVIFSGLFCFAALLIFFSKC